MKKSLKLVTLLLSLSLLHISCSSISGIEKEKTNDGFIKSKDLVFGTEKIQHPSLIPNFGIGKFNLNGNKQFENIQAYILDNEFYLEADYGNKSRESLNIDTIMFFTTRNKIAFTNEIKNAPNTFYKFYDTDGLTYENLKVKLTPENAQLLGRFLIADEVYISFVGERGRTDLFKVDKKLKKSMLAVINKLNKINNAPVIEEETAVKKQEQKEEISDKENTESAEEVVSESEKGVIESTSLQQENTKNEEPTVN